MKKNILICSLIVAFTFIMLTSLGFGSLKEEISDKTYTLENLNEIYFLSSYNKNFYITYLNESNNYNITTVDKDHDGNIYCIYSDEQDNNYLLFIDNEKYESLISKNKEVEIKGEVKKFNNDISEKINDSDNINTSFEKDIYIDTINMSEHSYNFYATLYYLSIIIGAIGILSCIFLLIKNNKKILKKFIKKYTLSKIFFWISFLPYIFVTITSIISIFNGFSFMFSTIYGLEAFKLNFTLTIFLFWKIFAVIIIYQIIYIIHVINKRKKKNNK